MGGDRVHRVMDALRIRRSRVRMARDLMRYDVMRGDRVRRVMDALLVRRSRVRLARDLMRRDVRRGDVVRRRRMLRGIRLGRRGDEGGGRQQQQGERDERRSTLACHGALRMVEGLWEA